jgi:hypothetical protein
VHVLRTKHVYGEAFVPARNCHLFERDILVGHGAVDDALERSKGGRVLNGLEDLPLHAEIAGNNINMTSRLGKLLHECLGFGRAAATAGQDNGLYARPFTE